MDLITQNIPALIVVTPLVMGLLTGIFGRKAAGWWMAMGTTSAVLAMAVQLLVNVLNSGTLQVTYQMGNWPAPFGIVYVVDPLNASVLTVVALIGAVVTLFARKSTLNEVPQDRAHFFWAIWQFCMVGLLGITITGDAFNLYVLLEISSLSTYTLVAMGKGRDRRALTAAINYVVLGSIGACFYLLGIAYLYMVTGSLNIADIHHILTTKVYPTWATDAPLYHKTVVAGFAFMAVGLSLKLALFPLHTWLPNAYTYAPSAVSALLASTATKVGAYAFIRVLYSLVGIDFAFSHLHTDQVLLVCAGLAIVVGSAMAIRQQNVKKLLAYSSIGQIGYICMGFALANQDGLTASVIHIFNHALTKGGMFMALGCVAYRVGGTRLEHLRGLGRQMPWTMAAFTAGGMGLIGVPLTAGFVSKWYLVSGAIGAGQVLWAGVVLVGSILALIYTWRCVEAIYFGQRAEGAPVVREAPLTMLVPTLLLAGASVYFGIDTRTTTEIAGTAARFLLGATP
ncbi:MAG: monovalent cation/H+ antiporter subunit D family protein [Planctomycetes bacterium]|nr:monovalent cation/H+ antiporter subunit D family protein [Planctomycetota bacterium]